MEKPARRFAVVLHNLVRSGTVRLPPLQARSTRSCPTPAHTNVQRRTGIKASTSDSDCIAEREGIRGDIQGIHVLQAAPSRVNTAARAGGGCR
eukprot:5064746-Prymnesium_polylepis.1